MARDKILLIDGSGYFYRAFYAIRQLSTSSGQPTNAVYGFVNMLLKTIETEKPTHLAIMFDTPKPTFRKLKFPAYKANRSKPPDELVVQIPTIFEAVEAFGIHQMKMEGFEADDLIGTIAKKAVDDGYDVEIITGDKDLMQLVTNNVHLYDSMKDSRIDATKVHEKFGVMPTQVVDLLALMGDTSDNIPGVKGIGEKTAAELLQKFGSLDSLYESLDQVPQAKRRELLETSRDMAFLSKELATVKCDVPMEFEWSQFKYDGPKKAELGSLFKRLEFFQLIKRLGLEVSPEPGASVAPTGQYKAITNEAELTALLADLAKAPFVSVDTETTGLHAHDAKIVGISLSGQAGQAFYIPMGHVVAGTLDRVPGQLDEEVVRKHVKPFLENPQIRKTGQNLKFDWQMLKSWGVDVQGIADDTLLMSYLIDSSGAHNLDALAMKYLSHQNITYEDVVGKGKNQLNFSEADLEKATNYAAEDADVAWQLTDKLLPQIPERGAESLYREVELPLSLILARMEYCGILVDKAKLEAMGRDLEGEMKAVEEAIYKSAGHPFNIQSPKQLGDVLFDELNLPVVKKTKTGRSTDESVLLTLSEKHEICRHILKFRGLAKLRSNYVEGLISEVHPKTGRVHSHFNQTVAATGRLSSSEPNLQNIPVASETGYDIRGVFVAPAGHKLYSFDYSQVELRLLAHMSQDKALAEAFKNDEDIHEATARTMFGISGRDVTPDERRIAKTINFGVVYGQTAFGLSQMLKIPPGQAKEFIEAYFKRYGSVKQFFETILVEARKNGFVSTVLGRRRYLPELNADNRMVREMSERAAINAPVQGSAADLIKKAMIQIDRRLTSEKLKTRMVLQVHDELVFEVPDSEGATIEKLVCEEMTSALPLSVPLKVDMTVGAAWS